MRAEGDENTVNSRIEKVLHDKIKEYVKTQEAKELGFTSISKFVNSATREYSKKYIKETDKTSDHFVMLDKEAPHRDLNLNFFSDHIFCNICQAVKCLHVDRVYEDESLILMLKKGKIKIPEKKEKL